MKKIVKLPSLLIMMSLLLFITACGKMSPPEPIEGSGYPHTYPRR